MSVWLVSQDRTMRRAKTGRIAVYLNNLRLASTLGALCFSQRASCVPVSDRPSVLLPWTGPRSVATRRQDCCRTTVSRAIPFFIDESIESMTRDASAPVRASGPLGMEQPLQALVARHHSQSPRSSKNAHYAWCRREREAIRKGSAR